MERVVLQHVCKFNLCSRYFYSLTTCEDEYLSSPSMPPTGPCERSLARGPATALTILEGKRLSRYCTKRVVVAQTYISGPHTTTIRLFSVPSPLPIHPRNPFTLTRPSVSPASFSPASAPSTR